MDSRAKTIYPRAMFRTGAQMSLLVLLAGLFLLWVAQFWPVMAVDDVFGGTLAQLHGQAMQAAVHRGWARKIETAPVTVIAINDSSLASHPWPWTPLDFSLFVQGTMPFKPELLAIDEVLDWDQQRLTPGDRQKLPQYEKILRDSLLRCPKVLLGVELGWPDDPDTIPPVREAPILRRVKGDLRGVPEWTVIAREPKEAYRLSAKLGFTNLPLANHMVHGTPLILRYQGRVVPSLVLQAILLWQKLSPDDVSVVLGSHMLIGGKLRIPIDDRGEMLVNFGAPLTTINFDDLLLANEQIAAKQKTQVPVQGMANAVVLLTRTDRGAGKLAFGPTRRGSAGELFAAAIATIQSQTFLHRAPLWVSGVLLALATVLAGFAPYCRKGKVVLWTALALLLYLAVAATVFYVYHLLLPAALPLGLALFLALYRLATPNNVWKLGRPVIL